MPNLFRVPIRICTYTWTWAIFFKFYYFSSIIYIFSNSSHIFTLSLNIINFILNIYFLLYLYS